MTQRTKELTFEEYLKLPETKQRLEFRGAGEEVRSPTLEGLSLPVSGFFP